MLVECRLSRILFREKSEHQCIFLQERAGPRSFPILKQVAAFLRENPWIRKMRVEGHSDNQGGEMYNLNLSQLRAISIARFLVQNGVEPDVLEAKGYGLSKPVDTNETIAGRART